MLLHLCTNVLHYYRNVMGNVSCYYIDVTCSVSCCYTCNKEGMLLHKCNALCDVVSCVNLV